MWVAILPHECEIRATRIFSILLDSTRIHEICHVELAAQLGSSSLIGCFGCSLYDVVHWYDVALVLCYLMEQLVTCNGCCRVIVDVVER